MDISAYFIRSVLWPSILITILLMIVGTIGNGLIVFIYRRHFYKSVPWLFIYVLAVLDILACIISMPSELLILGTYGSFPSGTWCQISRYLTFVFHGSACVILMAIALNRYEKVCRPNTQKLNLKRAKIFCIVTIIFAIVSFLPALFIYGDLQLPLLITDGEVKFLPIDHKTNGTELSNSTTIAYGHFCGITAGSNPILLRIFYLFQFILYLSLVGLVIFFYSRVICKMVSYSNKQQELLHKMSCQASRVDRIRDNSTENRITVPAIDEPTADFSRDFCHNEISVDQDKDDVNERIRSKNHHLSPSNEILKTHSIQEEKESDKYVVKVTQSDNNLDIVSTADSCDPLETNQLLIRRFHSTENFKMAKLQLVPSIDPYEALFGPVFLHASKTQKKRESMKKSKKGKSKPVNRSKSNVDLSLRMVKPKDGTTERILSCRSLERFSTMHCNNVIPDGTVTLTKRTPKGNNNCVIPLTGLSMKSAVSYDDVMETTEKESEANDEDYNRDAVDETANEMENGNGTGHEGNTPKDTEDTKPNTKTTSIHFKSIRIQEQTDKGGVQLRQPHRGSSSARGSQNSEKILTPSPRKSVDYRRRQSVRPIRANRTSRMLFWISLAFVLSFLPFWIIVLARTLVGPNFTANISTVELGAMNIFIRFTLISNAINPLIYGLMNTQFRNRCSNVFTFKTKHSRMIYVTRK